MQTTALTVTALGTTATLCEMPESLLAEWEFVTDGLRGIGPIQGFTVTHPDAGVLGVILRKGRDCHAELRLLDQEELLYAGAGRTLPYVLAHILRAHASAGYPIPADAEPTPVTAEPVPDPVRVIASAGRFGWTKVYYTGSHRQLHGHELYAELCMCEDVPGCRGFDLYTGNDAHVARHVRAASLTIAAKQSTASRS